MVFIAEPVDVATLPQDRLGLTDLPFWRYPRERLIDVYAEGVAPGTSTLYPECVPLVHPIYDRQRAPLGDYTSSGSVRRRVFAVQADGRVVLQHTRTSARDFERVPTPTPGQVP